MSSESTKAESAKYNHRSSVSRESLYLSSASLRWWDMATPKQALQALLDRRFELVCNGWVPVNTEPRLDFAGTVSAPPRWQAGVRAQDPWQKLGISPIKLLFRGTVNMGKVCDWFMQTTETRSLAIAKGANFRRQLRGKGSRAARRARPGATKVRPVEARVKTRGRVAPGRGRRRRRRRVGTRREVGGCDPRPGGPNNWLGRRLVERRYNMCQREPPPATAPSSQGGERGAAATVAAAPAAVPTPYILLESPPVLSVTGTRYKLVPVGNALPAPEKMQEAGAPGESRPRGDGGDGGASQRCLRECWVLLRNIEAPRSLEQSRPWTGGKEVKVGRRRRKPLDHNQPSVAHRTHGTAGHHLRGRAAPPGDLPSLQCRPDVRPTAPVQQDCAMRRQEQTQQGKLLADVQWQLVGLKECRVILRKINVLDGSHRNGCVGRQPPKVASPCKHPAQSLEERSGVEVELCGANCEKNPNHSLATNNGGAGASVFAKVQCSASIREMNPQESIEKKEREDSFRDAQWKKRGLKECKVVLEKMTPLVGNRFISLADGQLFRLGWNAIRNKSDCQEL